MRDIGILAIGTIVGFFAAWAKARWIDAPRERAGRREIERDTAYRALADSLNAPRKLVDRAILLHEIEREHELPNDWWKSIEAAVDAFKDEWDANWSYTLGSDKRVIDMVQRVWISGTRLLLAIDPDFVVTPEPPKVGGERASELLTDIDSIQDHARRAAVR